MTTLRELFLAAGAEEVDDGQIHIPKNLKPVKITIAGFINGLCSSGRDEETEVTFRLANDANIDLLPQDILSVEATS